MKTAAPTDAKKPFRLAAVTVPLWVGVFAVAAAALLPFTTGGERLELATQDACFQLIRRRMPRTTSAPLVIVDIDSETLEVWSEPSLFWGKRYAALVRQARGAGARVVGFDIVPAASVDDILAGWDVPRAELPDRAFAGAVQDAGGKVVVAELLGGAGESPLLPHPGLLTLDEMQNRIAFIDLPASADGVVRRGATGAGNGHVSFPALLAHLGKGNTDTLGDESGPFWINYTGRPLPRIAAHRLAVGNLSVRERQLLRGAVVLVGVNAPLGNDRHRTPLGVESGVEIHGQALATLWDNRPLRRTSRWQEGLVALLVGLVGLALARWLSVGHSSIALLGLALTYTGIVGWQFAAFDRLLPLSAPLAALALGWTGFQVARTAYERVRRLHVEAAFGRYASPQVRDYLVQNPEHGRLGGTISDISVLFLDVRGSVDRAVGRNPEDVIGELNRFFAQIVPTLDAHGGMLSRYTGDGFLALFGTPLPLPTHAQAATDAAREIVARVHEYNAAHPDMTPWQIGCAVYSGAALCGNLGIEGRAEFTVIGDTVNFAARLEQYTKVVGCELLLSGPTYDRLQNPPPSECLGPVRLRGQTEECAIWRVLTEHALYPLGEAAEPGGNATNPLKG